MHQDLTGDPAPLPDPRTQKNQHPRDNGQQCTHSPQQTRRARRAQPPEHRLRKQRKDGREHIPAEALGRQGRGRVAVVDVSKIIEDSQINGEDADLGATKGKRGYDPRHAGEGRPAKPEEAEGQEGRFDAGEVEAPFRRCREVLPVTPGDFFLVDAEDGAEDGANCNCAVYGTDLLDSEAACGEDQGDVVEGHVKHAPSEGCPQ